MGPGGGGSPAATVDSEITLYGRTMAESGSVTFFADSLRFDGRRPFAIQTFMSADTIYYQAAGGGSEIDHRDSELDSMLTCVFTGAALRVDLAADGTPISTTHPNERCRSGEYGRLNAPVTLCAFFARRENSGAVRWREVRPVPSFSGLGFYPEIEWLYREVETADGEATITIAADSTIENHETRMPNGEEVVIQRDRIRLGGTLVIDRSTGLPKRGDLRVWESMTLSPRDGTGTTVTKKGEYTISLSILLP